MSKKVNYNGVEMSSWDAHILRRQHTLGQLAGMRYVFDRITEDGTGGRVGFFTPMPRGYDNKLGLSWSDVRGRYWYPWKEECEQIQS